MLSEYDELPVHQTPHPLSMVANSDPGFDDGYFFGIFCPQRKIFCFQGMRINPNTDMVGGYVGINRDGLQRTVRFSRTWRSRCRTEIGPYRIEVVEPFRDIHLTLDENLSGVSFDLHWLGAAPAFEEAHHFATNRGKPTTDQTRYSQAGYASGWINIDGERIEVDRESWHGSRDHSWGLYHERPPLAPDPTWLPPVRKEGVSRALRFWTLFSGNGISGFYGIHESASGAQLPMNDTFGTPFEGRIDFGWEGDGVDLVAGRHALEFVPGTKILSKATITLTDADGDEWLQRVRPAAPAWVTATIGYQAGSWRDGGSMRTYHGDGPVVEWDEFDFSRQPLSHRMYDGREYPELIGKEYVSEVETVAPDGRRWGGGGHTELFLDGPFRPYGFAS